jgi:hypothetical protein
MIVNWFKFWTWTFIVAFNVGLWWFVITGITMAWEMFL